MYPATDLQQVNGILYLIKYIYYQLMKTEKKIYDALSTKLQELKNQNYKLKNAVFSKDAMITKLLTEKQIYMKKFKQMEQQKISLAQKLKKAMLQLQKSTTSSSKTLNFKLPLKINELTQNQENDCNNIQLKNNTSQVDSSRHYQTARDYNRETSKANLVIDYLYKRNTQQSQQSKSHIPEESSKDIKQNQMSSKKKHSTLKDVYKTPTHFFRSNTSVISQNSLKTSKYVKKLTYFEKSKLESQSPNH